MTNFKSLIPKIRLNANFNADWLDKKEESEIALKEEKLENLKNFRKLVTPEAISSAMKNFIAEKKFLAAAEKFVRSKGFVSLKRDDDIFEAIVFGVKYHTDLLCDSAVIQKIRDSKSDAESRRIIRSVLSVTLQTMTNNQKLENFEKLVSNDTSGFLSKLAYYKANKKWLDQSSNIADGGDFKAQIFNLKTKVYEKHRS
jgi:hypothetical protein